MSATTQTETPATRPITDNISVELTQDRSALWAIVITACGLALRLAYINRQSYWLDEGYTIGRLDQYATFSELWHALTHGFDVHTPLFYIFTWGWLHMGSATNEFWVRLPSAVASVAVIPATYKIAARFDRRAALLAAAIVAGSPLCLYYAQEARMYAMASAFAAWSAYFYLKASSGGKNSRWTPYVILRTLGCYTHVYVALLAVPELVILWRSGKLNRRSLLALCAPAASILLWFPAAMQATGYSLGSGDQSLVLALPYTAFAFVFGFWIGPSVSQLHQHPLPIGMADVVFIAVGAVATGFIALKWRRAVASHATLLTYVVCPVAITLAVAATGKVSFNVRYVLFVFPFVAVGLAQAVVHSWTDIKTRLASVTVVLLVALSVAHWWYVPRYAKEDNRGAAALIKKSTPIGTPVYVLGDPHPLAVYLGNQRPIIELGTTEAGKANRTYFQRNGMPGGSAVVVSARPWDLDATGHQQQSIIGQGSTYRTSSLPYVSLTWENFPERTQ